MMSRTLLSLLVLTLAAGLLAAETPSAAGGEAFKAQSVLTLGAGFMYSYKTGFADSGNLAWAPLLAWYYRTGPHTLFGMTLLRFGHHFAGSRPLYTFGYGFSFVHYLPGSRGGKPGDIVPWFGYSILLTQLFRQNDAGRDVAHNSRIALGADWVLDQTSRFYLEATWDVSDFPTLGQTEAADLNSVGIFAGYRAFF